MLICHKIRELGQSLFLPDKGQKFIFGNMAKTLHASHINHKGSKSTFNRL